MPPLEGHYKNVNEAVEAIIGLYSQNYSGKVDPGWKSRQFYDYYQVGGIWSGVKEQLGSRDIVSRGTVRLGDCPGDLTAKHVIVAIHGDVTVP